MWKILTTIYICKSLPHEIMIVWLFHRCDEQRRVLMICDVNVWSWNLSTPFSPTRSFFTQLLSFMECCGETRDWNMVIELHLCLGRVFRVVWWTLGDVLVGKFAERRTLAIIIHLQLNQHGRMKQKILNLKKFPKEMRKKYWWTENENQEKEILVGFRSSFWSLLRIWMELISIIRLESENNLLEIHRSFNFISWIFESFINFSISNSLQALIEDKWMSWCLVFDASIPLPSPFK
jgi:hypothetical protein